MRKLIICLTALYVSVSMFAQAEDLHGRESLASVQNASVQTASAKGFFLAYDVGYMTTMDNREYDRTDLDISRTVFAAGLGGGIGVGKTVGNSSHRLMGGVSALFSFGGDLKARPLIWYQLNTKLKNSDFQIIGGCFSRSKVEGYYSQLLFSEVNIINDNSFEGFQFSWKAPQFYYELGVDWKGQLRSGSPQTREQFTVYSAGRHNILPDQPLTVGYAGYMHHYANNYEMSANNVVDDIILYPYVEYDFGRSAGVQRALARLGYYQAVQRDRAVDHSLLTPAKGQVYLELRNWNVGFINDFLFGADLMPYYGKTGPEGKVYDDNSLYFGNPIMSRNANGKGFALYDRVSVYYEPKLLDKLLLRFRIDCHFNGGFAGWQQIIELKYKFGN